LAVSFAGWLIPLLLLNVILFHPAPFQTSTTFKIGAWGDDASRNNFGVEARIQTDTYDSAENSFSYFWVGDDLSNGAFIQFGYALEPGAHCLRGEVSAGTLTCSGATEAIGNSDARWEWQYWPDVTKMNFYFGIGPSESAGLNDTFHEYALTTNSQNTWSFLFENQTVAKTAFPLSPSIDPALIVAEGSAGNSSQQLGPARFDALSYYDGSRWRMVDSLVSTSYCGISVACAANEYGATSIGPNSLIVGSGIPKSPDGTLLWTSQEERLDVQVHPGVQFFVTSVAGTQQYTDSADLALPKGMFAYVSLPDTDSSTPGLLGWLGARDHFRGWEGSVVSGNLTAKILVDSNESITAVWTTDTTIPTIVLLITIVLIFAVTAVIFVARRRAQPVLR
jgi:hypothetical protein